MKIFLGEVNLILKKVYFTEIFENCEYETMENLEAVAKMIENQAKFLE